MADQLKIFQRHALFTYMIDTEQKKFWSMSNNRLFPNILTYVHLKIMRSGGKYLSEFARRDGFAFF